MWHGCGVPCGCTQILSVLWTVNDVNFKRMVLYANFGQPAVADK